MSKPITGSVVEGIKRAIMPKPREAKYDAIIINSVKPKAPKGPTYYKAPNSK